MFSPTRRKATEAAAKAEVEHTEEDLLAALEVEAGEEEAGGGA